MRMGSGTMPAMQESATILPAPPEVLEKARRARDPRFDGRFFVGVTSTGVYCRPVCRVRLPRAENVRFYPTAAAAMDAGFRPCLRCRPEAAPGTPAWGGTSATVSRGLRLIDEGALDDAGNAALGDRLGVTDRHLRRLFLRHVGATPQRVAETRRLLLAKQMLTDTELRMSDIAMAAGYGSIRSFNDHIRRVFDRTPTSLRGRGSGDRAGVGLPGMVLRLTYREPFDWSGLLNFVARRATPGVEAVSGETYMRAVRVGDAVGTLTVCQAEGEPALVCGITLAQQTSLLPIVARLRRMFDLEADPAEITGALVDDADIGHLVRGNPGQRLPGAWDPFEAAVRAIVGQQVSVAGATTVMGRIVERYGSGIDTELPGLTRLFPAPETLAELDDAHMPMPRIRAGAIRELAARVASGSIRLDAATDHGALREQLQTIRGIGPWTAEYVTMRALSDPDAFLASDLILMRIAEERFGDPNAAALIRRAERWRPWRAYAGLHLWRSYS